MLLLMALRFSAASCHVQLVREKVTQVRGFGSRDMASLDGDDPRDCNKLGGNPRVVGPSVGERVLWSRGNQKDKRMMEACLCAAGL